VQYGIHLPQGGRAASASAIAAVAKHAEDLGYADVWVSDHLVIPRNAEYPPSPYILEPIVALTWAAAATERIRLGTTVLVLPLRPPVLLAKMLGSLDLMSGGRLVVGAGSGWLEREFDALGAFFRRRGACTDETIDILRRCWQDDPIDFAGAATGAKIVDMRAKPQPGRSIPIWVGGRSEPAYRRAVERGDGWHGAFTPPAEARVVVERLRRDRPEESFTLSMRTGLDVLRDGEDTVLRALDGYRAAGFQHVVMEPAQRGRDAWLRCSEVCAGLFPRVG